MVKFGLEIDLFGLAFRDSQWTIILERILW